MNQCVRFGVPLGENRLEPRPLSWVVLFFSPGRARLAVVQAPGHLLRALAPFLRAEQPVSKPVLFPKDLILGAELVRDQNGRDLRCSLEHWLEQAVDVWRVLDIEKPVATPRASQEQTVLNGIEEPLERKLYLIDRLIDDASGQGLYRLPSSQKSCHEQPAPEQKDDDDEIQEEASANGGAARCGHGAIP